MYPCISYPGARHWDAFFALGCAHLASLAPAAGLPRAVTISLAAAAALLAAPLTLVAGRSSESEAPRLLAALAAATAAGVALAARVGMPRLDAKRVAVAVVAASAAVGSAPAVTAHFLPLQEFGAAYALAARLGGPSLHARAAQLALVTVHVQLPLGYAGVAYLRVAQIRKNRLLEVAAGERSAALYIRGVVEFILFTVAPYFAQRSSMEILNHLCFVDFANSVERSLRLDTALADDGALAAAAASNMTIEAHASALRSVVGTTYPLALTPYPCP